MGKRLYQFPAIGIMQTLFMIAVIISSVMSSCKKEPEIVKEAEPIPSDENVYKFTGDFDGNGFSDIAYWNSKDGAVWFGLYDGISLNWIQVFENIHWEAVPRDPNIYKFTGNYIDAADGKVKTYFGFWYGGDGNIWIAKFNGKTVDWSVAGVKKY